MGKETTDKGAYTIDQIEHLDDVQHIRQRVSMYLGTVYEPGLFKLDCEPIQNVLDEHAEGYGNQCNVTLDSSKNLMIVEDFARGIPALALKMILSKIHTGGKFNNKIYKYHAGSNSVGCSVLKALSRWLKIEVYNDSFMYKGKLEPARHAWIESVDGYIVNDFLEDLPNGIPAGKHSGTTVSYIADERVLKTTTHDVKRLCDQMNNLSYSNQGLKFVFNHDGIVDTFYHTGGVREQLSDFIKAKKLKTLIDFVEFEDEYIDPNGGNEEIFGEYNIIFTYGPLNTGDGNIVSYVNGNTTPLHGYHVTAFKAGASLALTEYVKDNDNLVPKALEKLNISGSLISNNLIAVIGVKHSNPLFDGQTKDSFKSADIMEPIKQTTRKVFGKWLRDNPSAAKKLVSLIIDYAKYEEERKKLKKNLIETKAVKSAFAANSVDPKKYNMCRSNNPEEKELFIVEGESAGGNVVLAQDREFQALYCLTGKILNVIKASDNTMSKVILELVQILGMGLPTAGKVNYNNLQYHKIIILTDADDDGAHIAALMLAFFFKFYPKIIEDGRVFIANPPIKKLTMSNGNSFYINKESDYDRLMSEFIVSMFDLISEKTNKVLSTGLFKEFIYHCRNYDILLKNHANSLAMDPNLLESIIINMKILTQCTHDRNTKFNKEFERRTGFQVRREENTQYFTFDRGIYHSNLKLDIGFIEHHFDIIVEKLNEIMIYGVYLRGKNSGKEYHGTIYYLMNIMNYILGPKIVIKRFKGLGEMKCGDLSETTINPMTRQLTQVTMNDAIKAEKAMKIFMSDSNIKFKRLFYAGKVTFD